MTYERHTCLGIEEFSAHKGRMHWVRQALSGIVARRIAKKAIDVLVVRYREGFSDVS